MVFFVSLNGKESTGESPFVTLQATIPVEPAKP